MAAALHWFKILCLVLLTLLLMRLVSWVPLALFRRHLRWNGWKPALVSNIIGLAAFLVFLRAQAVPGELVDPAAAVFGVVVYTGFLLADLYLHKRSRHKHEAL